MMPAAPAAIASAFSLGQPSRGLTSRKSDRPKFAIARAQAPMFSPSCGSERMMAGASGGFCIDALNTSFDGARVSG